MTTETKATSPNGSDNSDEHEMGDDELANWAGDVVCHWYRDRCEIRHLPPNSSWDEIAISTKGPIWMPKRMSFTAAHATEKLSVFICSLGIEVATRFGASVKPNPDQLQYAELWKYFDECGMGGFTDSDEEGYVRTYSKEPNLLLQLEALGKWEEF